MTRPRLSNFIKAVPVVILALYVLLNLVSWWTADNRQLLSAFEDDAYYYFKIARNVAQQGQLTFDGQSITNGFHPLWLLVLVPFFIIWHDPILVLRAIGTFSIILAGWAGFLSLHYTRRFSLSAYCLAAALTLVCIISFGTGGMETTLLLPLLISSTMLLEQTRPWRPESNDNKALVLGAFLSFVQLARLDAVLFNIIALTFAALKNGVSVFHNRKLFRLGLFPFVTGSLYLATNYAIWGHFVSTAGMVKTMRGDQQVVNTRFLAQVLMPDNPLDVIMWIVFAAMLALSVGYLAVMLLSRSGNRGTHLDDSEYVPMIVAIFFVVFAGYQLFGTTWVLWRWYAYPVLLTSVFVAPYLFDRIERHLKSYPTLRLPLSASSGVLVACVLVWTFTLSIKWGYWAGSIETSFQYDNYLVAQSLNQQFQHHDTLAMGDRAGSLAYFYTGNVLQLEGLVGDYGLITAIRTNKLANYMSRFGVHYVASYSAPPAGYSQWTLFTPLPLLSSGPYAEILLCKTSEIQQFEARSGTLHIWRWPGCDVQ
jgi:hypothetical protein